MKKVLLLILALIMALSLAACGGKDDSGNNTPGNSQNGGGNDTKTDGVYTIPKDKISPLGFATLEEKEAVIAEIPAELFKAVGKKLSYCNIQSSGTLPGYKYTLAINMYTEDDKAEAELKKLIDYYKSIGGTVEKSKTLLNDYDVKFDYAESVSITALSSSIQIQFSVVKE